MPRLKVTRDAVLFAGGLLGVVYEVLYDKAARPQIILLLAAMMGLPVVMGVDQRNRKVPEEAADHEPPPARRPSPPRKRAPSSGSSPAKPPPRRDRR